MFEKVFFLQSEVLSFRGYVVELSTARPLLTILLSLPAPGRNTVGISQS